MDEDLNLCFIEENEVNMESLDNESTERKNGISTFENLNTAQIVLISGTKILFHMKSIHKFENQNGKVIAIRNQNVEKNTPTTCPLRENKDDHRIRDSHNSTIEKEILLYFPGKNSQCRTRIEDVALLPDKSLIVASQCSTNIYKIVLYVSNLDV